LSTADFGLGTLSAYYSSTGEKHFMMMMKKKTILSSLFVAGLSLVAAGCGSKIAGTYTLSQSGTSALASYCSNVTLTLSENSNTVSGTGSSGQCTETLQGTDAGSGVIQVTSFTETLISSGTYGGGYNQSCVYTGTLTVNNNIVTGTLNATSSGNCYGATITINGTKTN
jgi:ABC-type oligopeptide transport system substrate-binding subunit